MENLQSRVEQLEEDAAALRAGLEECDSLLRAALFLIDGLLHHVPREDRIRWARLLDRRIEERHLQRVRDDAPELRWLSELREDFVSLHKTATYQSEHPESVRLRTPRERFDVLDGGKALSPSDGTPPERGE